MTTRTLSTLTACLCFLFGRMIYIFAVHHALPTLADVPAYLETAFGFILAWLVIEYFRSRRTRP
jgi:hypothetical protein